MWKKGMVLISLILLVGITVTGCGNLTEVRKELKAGGFGMWYPPESGVEPGQIWHIEGRVKQSSVKKPPDMYVPTKKHEAQFAQLEKKIDAKLLLSASFVNGLLGNAADLQPKLEAGTVKDVKMDFGKSKINRVWVEDLVENEAQFSAWYQAGMQRVRNREPGWAILIATVETSGMSYTMKVTNKAAFEAKTKGVIDGLIGGNVAYKWQSDKTVKLIIPDGQQMTIGFAKLKPELLDAGFGVMAPSDRNLPIMDYLGKNTIPFE